MSKEEFVRKATKDAEAYKQKKAQIEIRVYRGYVAERKTAWYRKQRNNGKYTKGGALQ